MGRQWVGLLDGWAPQSPYRLFTADEFVQHEWPLVWDMANNCGVTFQTRVPNEVFSIILLTG